MTKNVHEDIRATQAKWLYSAISGFCAAFFLTLFSGAEQINTSCSLEISTILFAIALPLFCVFSITHIYLHEQTLKIEDYENILRKKWVPWLTIFAFGVLVFAIGFLINHFSAIASYAYVLSIVFCFITFSFIYITTHKVKASSK